MARNISGAARREPLIELSALFGRFRVPGSDFTVHFASTFANTEDSGHRELLAELKPMRERVEAAALTDLTALLQRDLNDRRVARDLIPYLLGTNSDAQSKVGFFPAVLAVLIPAGYLKGGRDADQTIAYPQPSAPGDEGEIAYRGDTGTGFAWEVLKYSADGVQQPVGLIRINPRHSEIVVLDGQHRSNAFRYVANAYDPEGDIYGEFYRGITRPELLEADLPVTMIWFESDNQASIKPRIISRQLFVDVNNSAHSVSLARTILLDDRSLSSVAAQSFYNHAAEEGFKADSFSLLHAAFDMDSDLADAALPAFALTSPEIIENAFLWMLLGSARYSTLSLKPVERMRAQRNRNRFAQIVGTTDNVQFGTDEDDNAVVLDSPEHAETYRRIIGERVAPVLLHLMTGLSFLRAHYSAAAGIETWIASSESDTTVDLAWKKVFTGGEGLYWTFKDRVSDTNIYAKATNKIERRFREDRARALDVDLASSDAVFKSFATKAFQVGFAMSAVYLAERGRGGGDLIAATEDLIGRLGVFTPPNWVVFFRELRPLALKGDAAPKVWPTYRMLLVRMYDQGREELFEEPTSTPEHQIFERQIERVALRMREDSDEIPQDVKRIVEAERDRIVDILHRTGLSSKWLSSEQAVIWGEGQFVAVFEDQD